MTDIPAKPIEHSLIEDIQAFIMGAAFCALGVVFLTEAGLITGQTAGLAVLLGYITNMSFGPIFFLINLPFYALAWIRMGPRFTIKTFIAVCLVSVATEIIPFGLTIDIQHAAMAAFFGGGLAGFGLIILFRHGASLGGVGVFALFLQEKMNIQAGWTQLGFDIALFVIAFMVLDFEIVGYSLLGAIVTNMIVAVNHRKDRYIGR